MNWRRWTSLSLIASAFLAAPALAQNPPRPGGNNPNTPNRNDRPAPQEQANSPIKTFLTDQATNLETQITQLAQRRADVVGVQAELLELFIDLRIVARATVGSALEAKNESDPQVIAMLRTLNLLGALAELEKRKSPESLTPQQSATLQAFHQATYQLGAMKTIQQTDETCKLAGLAISALINENPPSAMRPQPIQAQPQQPSSTKRPREQRTAPRTLTQLEAQARQLTISPGLRRQLLMLARMAANAQNEEQEVLSKVLLDSVDLSEGLAGNIAVDGETRQQIEAQLAEGLALYADSRLRAIGQKKLEALAPYRQLLLRVGKMKLAADYSRQLAPAFAFARTNPRGEEILKAIEGFTLATARFSQIGRNPDLTPSMQKTADVLEKRFATIQKEFLGQAQNLGGGILSTGPEELRVDVEAMGRCADLLELLNRVPVSVAALQPYRPRLALGFQKRVETMATALQQENAAGEEALRTMQYMDSLADQARKISSRPPIDLPANMVSRYAAEYLPAFEKKCQTMIGDAVNELATNSKVDESRVAKLATAGRLRESLQDALEAESAIAKSDILARWADWPVGADRLAVILTPYRNAMAEAFNGFNTDKDEPMELWKRLEPTFAPLLDLLHENGAYASACLLFPTGLSGEVGRLMTPFGNAPFAQQRYAAFMILCWSALEQQGNPEQATAIANRLAKRLSGK